MKETITKGLIIGLILAGQSCSMEDSNFVQIIESPDEFDGKEIEVTGIYYEQFEDVAIYLSKASNTQEAILMDLPKSYDRMNGKRVRIRGRFDMNSKRSLSPVCRNTLRGTNSRGLSDPAHNILHNICRSAKYIYTNHLLDVYSPWDDKEH